MIERKTILRNFDNSVPNLKM